MHLNPNHIEINLINPINLKIEKYVNVFVGGKNKQCNSVLS